VILPRPRGWHFDERHVLVDGRPAVAALVDAGLYLFHNAQEQLGRGSGPYFYLPKMESHLEARLWNDVFTVAQETLGLPYGTVRATVLIETIPAAFEMEEILYELRDHVSGLNAGRWDYLFSIIKTFRDAGPDFVLPDRGAVTMTAPFMRAYTELLVSTCHKRGAFAMGGMAAFIPSRRDPEVNARALAQVRADKEREAGDGFDGSWVAHPDLVPVCREVFDAVLGDRPTSSTGCATTCASARRSARRAVDARIGDREGAADQRRGGAALPGGVAGRQRRRRDPQPHGGRRHGGDLAVADLAVGARGHGARHGERVSESSCGGSSRRSTRRSGRASATRPSAPAGTPTRGRCSPTWRSTTTTSTS
jgi:hypothetical protein